MSLVSKFFTGGSELAMTSVFSFGQQKMGGEQNNVQAVGKALLQGAAMTYFAPVYEAIEGIQIAAMIGKATVAGVSNYKSNQGKLTRRNFGGNYQDTEQAYTMRQAALQKMNGTASNINQVLGNEASFMHR